MFLPHCVNPNSMCVYSCGPVKDYIYLLGLVVDPFCLFVNQCVQIALVNGFILAGLLRDSSVAMSIFGPAMNASMQIQLGQNLSVGWRYDGK